MEFIIQKYGNTLEEEGDIVKSLLDNRFNRSLHEYIIRTFNELESMDIEKLQGKIPLGNINFVREYLYIVTGKSIDRYSFMEPLEVPDCLREEQFLNREYGIFNWDEIPDYQQTMYYKDASIAKNWLVRKYSSLQGFRSDIAANGYKDYDKHKYVVSSPVDFIAEYRLFVYNDEVIGVRYYNGGKEGCLYAPGRKVVKKMISRISKARANGAYLPYSYTLDIGVDRNDTTSIIEMHNFVSCGLYGFSDIDILYMYKDGIRYELDRVKYR